MWLQTKLSFWLTRMTQTFKILKSWSKHSINLNLQLQQTEGNTHMSSPKSYILSTSGTAKRIHLFLMPAVNHWQTLDAEPLPICLRSWISRTRILTISSRTKQSLDISKSTLVDKKVEAGSEVRLNKRWRIEMLNLILCSRHREANWGMEKVP